MTYLSGMASKFESSSPILYYTEKCSELVDLVRQRLPDSHLSVLTLGLSLRLLMDILYVFYLHPLSASAWPLDSSPIGVFLSYSIVGILTLSIPRRHKPATGLFGWMLVTFSVFPLLSYASLAGVHPFFVGVVSLSFFISMQIPQRLNSLTVYIPSFPADVGNRLAQLTMAVGLLMCFLLVTGLAIENGAPSLDPLFYQNTYEIRSSNQLPNPLFGYILNWTAMVIIPFLAVAYWYTRSKVGLTIVVTSWLLLYLYVPRKTYGAALIFTAAIVWLYNRDDVVRGGIIASILTTCSLVMAGIVTATQSLIFISSARLFFWQGRGQIYYYQFFSRPENPFVYLSNTGVVPISFPYSDPVPFVVSGTFIGEHNMNIGIFGEAFSQAGFIGVFAAGFILGIILLFADGVFSESDDRLLIAASCLPAWSLTQTGLTVTMLTGGVWLILLLGLVYRPAGTY